MTTSQSASRAVYDEVKRGGINTVPQAPQRCGGEASGNRSGFFIGRLLAGLVCAIALLASPLPLQAEERINDYQVEIEVAEDGVLEVTEHIFITSQRDKIVHGIDREIPLAFIAADGHRARSYLTVLDVERDGEPENYEIIETNRGAVIRIGSSDIKLAAADHLYSIDYQINRVVSYSDEHDRLIWNVNGTEGRLPIDAFSVRVALPEGAEPLAVHVYTGYFGEHGKDAIVRKFGNEITFEATRPYAPGENMTIELLLPKGVIQPPDEETLSQWEYDDYASIISVAVTFAWSALLALFLWFLFGRDPRPGVIVPRWDSPGGISPGRVNYSFSRNFEPGFWTAFSASVIDLAVKGKVVLEDLEGGITVRRVSDEEDSRLPTEQAVILEMLPPVGESFRFNRENAAETGKLGEAFSNAIVTEVGRKHYKPRRWIWINFGLLMFLTLVVRESDFTVGVEYLDGVLPSHWIAAMAAWFFATKAVLKWRTLLFASPQTDAKARSSILLNLSIAAAILLVSVLIIYANAPVPRDNLLLVFMLMMLATLVWAFIGRFSRQGREVMDGIEGLRLYLELAEKDRMALADAPKMSPAHYETLLPYAVALGVEKAWSEHFETALAEAHTTNTQGDYHPTWYVPKTGTFAHVAGISDFSSSVSTRIESSLPTESGSYGSGSSGGSGGGRGGGGVSGW